MKQFGDGISRSALAVEKRWWIGVLVVCVGACLMPIACQLDPKAVLAPIPIGSKLSELDKYLKEFKDGSDVEEWIRVRAKDSPEHKTTKYGSFFIRKLGAYEAWTATKETRDAFTGEVRFFHRSAVIPDDLAPSYVFSLIYVNGVLREKGYGHLPG